MLRLMWTEGGCEDEDWGTGKGKEEDFDMGKCEEPR